MPSIIIWFFLVWVLCLSTFGLWLCSLLVITSCFMLFGFITMVMYAGQNTIISHPSKVQYKKLYCLSHSGIPNIVNLVQKTEQLTKYDKRLTGSLKIDEPLQEIISYIIRDYINIWYKDLSSNDEFVCHLKELFKNVLNNISRSAIEIDWVSFFTKHLVDDFASHLRVYRLSEKSWKRAQKEQSNKYETFEDAFFDFELSMEKNICRDVVCLNGDSEKRYLSHLSDVLLYLLLPSGDFQNTCLRYFLKNILCNSILHPTISLFADPDFINQNLIWACKDHILSSKAFLTVIRRTDSVEELEAVKEIAKHELKVHKAKDTGDKDEMKQHIKSISYVHDLAHQRYKNLLSHYSEGETDSIDLSVDIDWKSWIGSERESKLIALPFDIVLNNNIGLHYFSEFMSSMNAQGYVFFYHNIEGYRATAETILSSEKGDSDLDEKFEMLRKLAMQMFDIYLGENASHQVKLDELLLKKLYSRIKTEQLNESFFDDVQAKVYKIMQDEFYMTTFKSSKYYVKLLAELELLPDALNEESTSTRHDDTEKLERPSTPDEDIVITELLGNDVPHSEFCFPDTPGLDHTEENRGEGALTAEIYNTGVTHHAGKTFAVYAIAVSYQRLEGPEERWFVVRRYSEFYEFYKNISEKFPTLSNFDFPSKKAFNNLSRHLMEKRRHMLNEYLVFLLCAENIVKCNGLQIMVYNFLEPRVCDKEKKSLVRTVGTIVNPIRSSVKTVGTVMKLVPNTIFGLKDGLVKVWNKNNSTSSQESCAFEMDKVSAELDFDAEDIPLRIVLLLLDEVFDLKSKDLWFRRRIMILLRQIVKTTQGDAINRKLLVYIKGLMSTSQISDWLKMFSQAFWPNGLLAELPPERDANTKFRTRLAAKALLFCCVPDELKHVIGNETSFKGAMTIFGLFQNPALNRRLIYVILESFFTALFSENNIPKIIIRLNGESPRTAPMVPLSRDHFGDLQPHKPDYQKGTHQQKANTRKGHVRRSSLSCIGRQMSTPVSSPKLRHIRKKSLETAVFYTNTNQQCDDELKS